MSIWIIFSVAKSSKIKLNIHTIKINDQRVEFIKSNNTSDYDLRQIYWNNNDTWDEANLFAYDLLVNEDLSLKTIKSYMFHLHAYAEWLENNNIDWKHFPEMRSERCLILFRGDLIKKRNSLELQPSTVTHRMRSVIKFYRWVKEKNLIDIDFPMWKDKNYTKKIVNRFGFENTLEIVYTDVSIPLVNQNNNIELEGGLFPISPREVPNIINVAKKHSSIELYLMLKLGFYTGMRIGTICDLKVATLENSILLKNKTMSIIHVGPNSSPPVNTKYSKDGAILIPTDLVHELIEYCYSTRRLKRVVKAVDENSDLIFLTRNGGNYLNLDNKSINVAMHRLRVSGLKLGYDVFKFFHFHQTRSTFATVLMEYCLKKMSATNAIQLVKDACMHKDEAVTFKYIKFLEKSKNLEKISNEYTNIFLGIENE